MLTKTDLNQIKGVVRDVVDERLDAKVKPMVDELLDQRLKPIKKDLSTLEKIKKDISYIKKTVSIIVKNYDEADVKLEKRVRRIGQHLALPQ